jgi:hypothetical protein
MIHVYVTWNIVAGPDGLPGLPTRVQANHDDDDDDDDDDDVQYMQYIYTPHIMYNVPYIYMYICICICRYCHQKMQISCATALSSHFSQTVLGSGRVCFPSHRICAPGKSKGKESHLDDLEFWGGSWVNGTHRRPQLLQWPSSLFLTYGKSSIDAGF